MTDGAAEADTDNETPGAGRATLAYERHWPVVRSHAYRLVRDGALADDLTQEAFLRLWLTERSGTWPELPVAWLTRVVTNLAVSAMRRSSVVRRRSEDVNRHESQRLARSPGPADSAEHAASVTAVAKALGQLSSDKRRALLLAGAGFSADEIGRQIGRSPEAVRTLLCRARRSMREAVPPELRPDG